MSSSKSTKTKIENLLIRRQMMLLANPAMNDKSFVKILSEQAYRQDGKYIYDGPNGYLHSPKKTSNANINFKSTLDKTNIKFEPRESNIKSEPQEPQSNIKSEPKLSTSNMKNESVDVSSLSYSPFQTVFVKCDPEAKVELSSSIDLGLTIKQEKEDDYENHPLTVNIKPEPNEIKDEIKEEALPPLLIQNTNLLNSSKPKMVYKPRENTLKNKEFTGFSLFSIQHRKVIKATKPKAHYMEVQHAIRKDWLRLTANAKKIYVQKATRLNQEKACIEMLKKIKDALEIDEKDRLSGHFPPPTKRKISKQQKSTTTNVAESEETVIPKNTFNLRPRLKMCSVILKQSDQVILHSGEASDVEAVNSKCSSISISSQCQGTTDVRRAEDVLVQVTSSSISSQCQGTTDARSAEYVPVQITSTSISSQCHGTTDARSAEVVPVQLARLIENEIPRGSY